MMTADEDRPVSTHVSIDVDIDTPPANANKGSFEGSIGSAFNSSSTENMNALDQSTSTASGQPSDSLRDQSSRLSTILQRKTEIFKLKNSTSDKRQRGLLPEPSLPKPHHNRVESSSLNYWTKEARKAKGHGGDYKRRHRSALRASIGSVLLFSALVFPDQRVLGAVWIGNIFFHTNLKDSFGATYRSVRDFSKSIIITTALSTPIAFFLSTLSTRDASIFFPFLVFLLSFLIMTCPQLASRNLMILVLYLALAAPVHKSVEWWMPLGYAGTYLIGLGVALLVSCCSLALGLVHQLLSRQESDMTMLLLEAKAYADHTGVTPEVARTAMATIEMLCDRISSTTKQLKAQLPAAEVELSWRCRRKAALDLAAWVKQSEILMMPLKDIKVSLSQRVIGEEYSVYSEQLRDVKAILSREVGPSRDRMIDAMISSIAVCHAWANPSAHRTVLPDVERELEVSIEDCRSSFHRAMGMASAHMETNSNKTPVFAHLTRRMTAFNALFEFGDSLLGYLRAHSWEKEELFNEDESIGRHKRSISSYVLSKLMSFIDFVEKKWLWHNPDTLRLALKTAFGMLLASLFVSVPYLWKVAKPFGVWPGLTVASVNLGSTGSSFAKAADRLSGTLLAAAFALLVTDLFPGANADYVKMPALGVFTYAAIYLRSSNHAYTFTYAATSIGAMLYGSATAKFNVLQYVPKRIELIFVGVGIFSIVELILFPRSSKRLVESSAYESFQLIRDFFQQASHCAKRMENHITQASAAGWKEHYETIFFDDADDPYHFDRLSDCHNRIKSETSRIKKELESALDEPNLGLAMALDPTSFRSLASELQECEVQALLLLKSMRQIATYYQGRDHPIRELDWAGADAKFLEEISSKANFACQWLKSAFPDGRIRPQQGNTIKAITAAASFRQIADIRLRIVDEWSKKCRYLQPSVGSISSDPVSVMKFGITTTYILELCRHYQNAGKHLEEIVHKFPASENI